jgi:hypothetical protein
MNTLILLLSGLLALLLSYDARCGTVDIINLINKEAIRQGLDPKIAISVAKVESSLDPQARGKKGEIGLFQLRPELFPYADLRNISTNIRIGVAELIYWKSHCPVRKGLEWVVCYNNGGRHPKYPRLHPYYKKVMAAL